MFSIWFPHYEIWSSLYQTSTHGLSEGILFGSQMDDITHITHQILSTLFSSVEDVKVKYDYYKMNATEKFIAS